MSIENDPRLANSTTGIYLQKTFNIEPRTPRCFPGVNKPKTYSERLRMGLDCDEVYPGIIIGSGETAKNIPYLRSIGVTHMINTAENDVNMNPKRYAKEGICYKGFRCPDLPQSDISQHFDECVEFIHTALSFSVGKVFIGCLLGYSRSTAIVAAYLMQKKNFTAAQALMLMRETREVKPNVGFLQQLGHLDNKLRAERYRKLPF